jgi:hypothetical membrane protein
MTKSISKNKLNIFLPIILAGSMTLVYYLCIIIAVSFYPGGFTIARNYISDGGNPNANPDGWLIWMAGHVLNGIIMGFLVRVNTKNMQYLQPKNMKDPQKTYQHGKVALYMSAVGFVFMGLVPAWHGAIWDVFHGIFATFIMGGLILGMWSWGRYIRYVPDLSRIYVGIITCLAFAGPIIGAISQGYNLLSGNGFEDAIMGVGSWFLTMPFVEWMLMFSYYGAFIVLSFGLKHRTNSTLTK